MKRHQSILKISPLTVPVAELFIYLRRSRRHVDKSQQLFLYAGFFSGQYKQKYERANAAM